MTQTVDIQATLQALATEMAAQEVQQTYKGFSIADLRTVFTQIQTPGNWKGPIAVTMSGETVLQSVAAIEYFTATTPTVRLDVETMRYLVTSVGYQAGPAGDH